MVLPAVIPWTGGRVVFFIPAGLKTFQVVHFMADDPFAGKFLNERLHFSELMQTFRTIYASNLSSIVTSSR